MIKTYIKREKYLNKIIPFIDKDLIKVIVGQRRVGKSYLLYQIIDLIKKKNSKSNIIYINKELHEYDHIKDSKSLTNYVEKKADKAKNYLFIDEVQDIFEFEKALRSFNASGKYDIYCTGSNANLLSGELASTLSGRYIEIDVYSLSYQEFLGFYNLKNDNDSLLKYIKFGGLPYLINLDLNNDEVVYSYLKNVYNTIILKDVVARYNIRNVSFLENLIYYLADNLASLVSANKISQFLKSQKINISANLIIDYLLYLSKSFFIHQVKRKEIQGKKIFEINEKYYFQDLGLKHSIAPYRQVDIAKILENLVYNHLKYLSYQVFIGKLKDKEIDFVAIKGSKIIYVQVTYLLSEKNRKREFDNLLQIKDNHEKIVVSMDPMISKQDNYQGIRHINIREFLSLNF